MKIFKQEEGNSLVLVGMAFMGIMMMAGLVLDGGALFMEKRNLQKAANAAALSGAQELTTDEDAVQQIVDEVIDMHGEITSMEDTEIDMNERVDVYLTKDVSLSFGGLFGKETSKVKVHAAANLASIGMASGAAPLGIDERVELNYYEDYKLKVSNKKNEHGYHGILALGGPGAKRYEENLRHGFDGELEIGDVIETQTGNIAGKTRRVVREKTRYDCGYEPGEEPSKDCERVLLIPVYKPHDHREGKQLKRVEVTGFAYFYIKEPLDRKDTSITGMFIKRVGQGEYREDAQNKGAYAIRLTR